MIKVLCTVVFVLGSGERRVEQLDGIVLRDGDPRIFVDFGEQVPTGPQAVWVPENDCLYYEDPSKVYGDNREALKDFINKYRNGLGRMLNDKR